MKFNEKLIELRKKEGLSQEELGYKLDVTRQTVSKWELGQTTPEMDKLIEISKMFNISVDELINDSETNTENDQVEQVKDKETENKVDKKKKWVRALLIGLVIAVVIFFLLIFLGLKVFNVAADAVKDAQDKGVNQVFGLFDYAQGLANEQMEANKKEDEENLEMFNKVTDMMFDKFYQSNFSLDIDK